MNDANEILRMRRELDALQTQVRDLEIDLRKRMESCEFAANDCKRSNHSMVDNLRRFINDWGSSTVRALFAGMVENAKKQWADSQTSAEQLAEMLDTVQRITEWEQSNDTPKE